MNMKMQTKTLSTIILIATISFSACKKDKMIPPTIDFKTGTGYISTDSHVALNMDFMIGVDAKRTEAEDDLKKFVVTRSYDGGTDSTIDNLALSTAEAGEFQKDYSFTTRNTPGIEKYSFTVANRDGLITTESITITVP
jgi:hypothetical protein